MRPLPARYPALVLRAVPYSESDLVVHLFCHGRGRIGAFARGARKSIKRFGGGLEPFSLLNVEVQDRRGSDLLELKSAEVVDAHLLLRSDLSRLAHAGYATELCRELLQDNQPNDVLFELLLEYLRTIARAGPRSLCLRAFELGVLQAVGLAPRLDHCTTCGDVDEVGVAFDPDAGGLLCARCATAATPRIDRATLSLMRALQERGLAASETASEEGLPMEGLRRILRLFIDHHVRHGLRSLSFIREVGAPL